MDFDYSDIVPVDLNTETPQLCQIIYSDEYKLIMGKLLSLMKQKEYSLRALNLTSLGIEQLASHYTTWIYRYDIINNLPNFDYYSELDWCEQIALDNEKNYQIWNYRQLIIEKIGFDNYDPIREYPIMEAMLDGDNKNHHVWSFRKWLVEKFNMFESEKEVEFVSNMIELDVKNNSAWCHRFFLRFNNEKNVKSEIEYVKEKIELCPQNASTWNYLIGIFEKFDLEITELKEFCFKFLNLDDDKVSSSFALETLAKIYIIEDDKESAIRMYTLLKEKYDPIRCNYWNFKISTIEN
ncbi:unnamed protein product [Candida verbasci]|uniref:Protein farnesyltransferase/geranylgeranyltransferase type-1 subunit alpha n=1 Tax=Candida verbasci TaxID=1227364 RepID=A0A9W4TUJ6_9ASCO|nr:unnamed protein product [Candida verbasci]